MTIEVLAPSDAVMGIDVSHYQPVVNWSQCFLSGIRFAMAKATEGMYTQDQMFAAHTANAKKAGMMVGSYHFFHPEQSAIMQAKNYVNVIGKWTPGDLPPVIDFETHGGVVGAGPQVQDALAFLQYVEQQTGRKPMVYMGWPFFESLGSPLALTKYPFWIAEYGVKAPRVPAEWGQWTFWQYADSGSMAGTNHMDTDMFFGNIDQLKAFCA